MTIPFSVGSVAHEYHDLLGAGFRFVTLGEDVSLFSLPVRRSAEQLRVNRR